MIMGRTYESMGVYLSDAWVLGSTCAYVCVCLYECVYVCEWVCVYVCACVSSYECTFMSIRMPLYIA